MLKSLNKNQKYGLSLLALFILVTLVLFFIISKKLIYASIALVLISIIIYKNFSFYRKLPKKVIDELGNIEKTKEYLIELLIFAVIAGLIIWLISLLFVPLNEVEVSCNEIHYPNFKINIYNSGKEPIEDFTFFVRDNWINSMNLTSPWGVIYGPKYNGIYFYEPSIFLCNATNIEFSKPFREDCSILDCPYKTREPAVKHYAIKVYCNYVPPKSDIEFDVNVFPIDKGGVFKDIELEKNGLMGVSYYGNSQKYTDNILNCGTSIKLFNYEKVFRYDPLRVDIFIFFKNKFGFFLGDILPYILFSLVFLVILLIFIWRIKKNEKIF